MILGIDTAGVAQNHLAEVKTGEGKSITLGALAIVFALLGQSVNVVCYNPYLSTRDWLLFQKVFDFFDIFNII
jgi:preprotein translocase subunit SecA